MSRPSYLRLRVGALLVAGLAILAFGIFTLGGGRLLIGNQTLWAHFHRVNGLQAGAPVTLSGVTIGAVESIRFPRDPMASYVVVRLGVESGAASRIHIDSVASIRTMGLLGDKFVDLSGGNPHAQIAPTDYVLKSQDPIDYEALLGQKDTGDFFVNIMQASASMRDILRDVDKGSGLLSQLVHGRQGKEISALQQSIEHLNHATEGMEQIVNRVNSGQGVAGILLADNQRSRKVVADIAESADSLRASAQRMDQLSKRLETGRGLLPRLVEDRRLGDEVLGNVQNSSRQANDILYKINTGQGTLGKLVNDPTLYNQARNLIGGGSWGFSLLRGLYSVTHPFGDSSSTPSVAAVRSSASQDGDRAGPAASDSGR